MRNLPFDCTVGSNAALVTVNQGGLGCAQFDSVTQNGAVSAPVYGNEHLYGVQTVSMKMITSAAGGDNCYVEWFSSIGSQSLLYFRIYVYLTANPSAAMGIAFVNGTGNLLAVSVGIGTTGKLRLFDANGSQIAISTASVALNQWIRIELDAAAGASAVQTARLYNTADAAEGSPTETISGANTVGAPAALIKIRMGQESGINSTYWQTNLDVNNTGQLGPYVVPTGGHTWYVSKNGDNSTGLSWAHAWNEMDQWDWAAIAPGDLINVDGGAIRSTSNPVMDPASWAATRPGVNGDGMVYTASLVFRTSGTLANPIRVNVSNEGGHNGTVIHFGGRETLLPEANQVTYIPIGIGGGTGIDLRSVSYVNINGTHRSGWIGYGWGQNKNALIGHAEEIRLDENSSHINLANFEILDCGVYEQYPLPSSGATVWKPDNPGIRPGGTSNSLTNMLVHDCGQDPLQGASAASAWTFTRCWFYTRRQHTVYTGYGFQAGCQAIADQDTTHVDGIQWYAGGTHQGPMTFDTCLFGPMNNQGLYLGDSSQITSFDNVTITNCLYLAPISHGIQGDVIDATTPANWSISHCTIHGPSTAFPGYTTPHWFAVELESGTGHSIKDTIVTWNGGFYLLSTFTGTCSGNIYNGGANTIPGGTNVDPGFVRALDPTNNTPTYTQIAALDLTPTAPAALGKGSSLHSIQDLLDLIDGSNGGGTPRHQVAFRTQPATRTQRSTRTQLASRTQVGT